ncbi:HAD family hydrolase [Deinococcus sp.]|uniref:HAD family hydrolase n=1 Tax=Deinococcus sp. TaxID=47478 RepID=UPI002869A7D8|nr:HAD family hydrolase [Deinococcus sp.]
MRAVLFDLDGTLHDRAATIRAWLAGHVARFDLPAGDAARFRELDDLGDRPKAEVMPHLVREFMLPYAPADLLDDVSARAFSHPVSVPHSARMLAEFRRQGVCVGIVTNGWSGKQRQTSTGLELADPVDEIVISREGDLSKPDPRISLLALSRLGVDAADTWFVGDSPGTDVWGPQQVGRRAAHLPTGHVLDGEVPDVTLRDLQGVLALP